MRDQRDRSYRDRTSRGSSVEVKVEYRGDSREEKDKALDRALSQLKKNLIRDGILNELRERQYYKSPGRKEYEWRRSTIHKHQLKLKKKDKPMFRNNKDDKRKRFQKRRPE